jgi:enoyl-CoA hydratase/carnithine racemase
LADPAAPAAAQLALRVSVDGPVATLTMNRPRQRNALSTELMQEILAALHALRSRPDVHAVILAGEGPAFCAGHDLAELRGLDEDGYRAVFQLCSDLMMALHEQPQPVIARVHGIATAAGCQLVAACDLAIAGHDARFATPGVKIGLFCSTPMVEVARAVGRKRSLELLLTGTPIDAATAADWGLVNRVVEPERLADATDELARAIADASGVTLAFGKQAFYRQLDIGLPEAYRFCAEVMTRNALAADAQEGMSAFLEKREPTWTG